MDTANYQREIIELHQFFTDWFAGRLSQSEVHFARFSQVIADGFALITPDGVLIERDTLQDRIFAGYGQRPDFHVWIKNPQIRHRQDDIIVVTYEEWQRTSEGGQTARLSTAIFRENDNTPNGLEWLHVHETWLSQNA